MKRRVWLAACLLHGAPAKLRPTRLVCAAALGSVVGFLGESFHLRMGVWAPLRGDAIPWWVGLVYFPALLVAGALFFQVERSLGHPLRPSRRLLGLEGLAFLLLYLLPALLHRHELPLMALVAAVPAVRLSFFRRRGDLVVAGLAMGIDLAVEGSLVAAGLYRYPGAQWTPLPLWLCPLWGGLGLALRRFFRVALGP